MDSPLYFYKININVYLLFSNLWSTINKLTKTGGFYYTFTESGEAEYQLKLLIALNTRSNFFRFHMRIHR